MGFWETVGATALGGVAIALMTVAFGVTAAFVFTDRRKRAKEREERGRAAAVEFYRAYGGFFAAWKIWDDGKRANGSASPGDRLSALERAAEAEGALESFLARLALDRRLEDDDLARVWCFRSSYKQLRYAIRADERLQWWRTDPETLPSIDDPDELARRMQWRAYIAFKRLAAHMAGLLAGADSSGDRPPDAETVRGQLEAVTGDGGRFAKAHRTSLDAERQARERAGIIGARRDWEWVVIAEQLMGGPRLDGRTVIT